MSDTSAIDPKTLRIKRLRYRSWHRGCKETDIILGRFSDTRMSTLSDAQLDIYEQLLEEQDVEIWQWITHKSEPENKAYLPILALLTEETA